jgi:hypothetical protein
VFGIGMIVLHNTLDAVQVAAWNGPGSPIPSAGGKLWMVLHQAGLTPILGAGSPLVMIQYPLIPWIGVMAAGYAFGSLYELERDRRITVIRRLGLAAIAAFVVIRATNLYGDPSPWTVQPTLLFTILSFINTTKYPPSLLYLLMTLGPSLVALAWFESRERFESRTGPAVPPRPWRRGPVAALTMVGRVPLFFYLWQWVLAHSAAIVANIVVGRSIGYLFLTPPALFEAMARNGFRLWVVYLCWACIIAVEYPLCGWFAGVKRRRRDWWLSYL